MVLQPGCSKCSGSHSKPAHTLRQVVLSPEQDPFFAKNLMLNYGDLAENVKEMLDQFQAKTKSSKDLSSIADMQV